MSVLIIKSISFHGCRTRIPVNASSYQNSLVNEYMTRKRMATKKIIVIKSVSSFFGGIFIMYCIYRRDSYLSIIYMI